jgi:hypothetical protein
MENPINDETREMYIRRLARNRYDLRMQFKFRLQDTAEDDWRIAEESVRREEARRLNNE